MGGVVVGAAVVVFSEANISGADGAFKAKWGEKVVKLVKLFSLKTGIS